MADKSYRIPSNQQWYSFRGSPHKELVSNAYDAGATEVKIKLDLPNSRIIVRDNGRGMNMDEIKNRFLTIGFSSPPSGKVDELGRKRIGTFGIGCLSVFPYCKKMQVITKKRGSSEIIELDIGTESFFKGKPKEIEKEKVPYTIYKSDLPQKEGETIVILSGIEQHILEELKKKGPSRRSSIDKYTGFEKFKWTLCQYTPILFSPERKDLSDFFGQEDRVPMRLWLDGVELFRNVPQDAQVLEKGQENFGKVTLKYVITTSMRPIEPEEARGIQIRLRDVAIGLPRDFDVTKLTGRVCGKLNYLYGEAQILSGLDSSLMIDRDSFSYTQEVADIYEFFRKKLRKWNDELEKWAVQDKEIYEAVSELEDSAKLLEKLKREKIIHFSKERLRISKSRIGKKRGEEISSRSKRIQKALSKQQDYKVRVKKGDVGDKSPIEVDAGDKSIVVYEDHPELTETISIGGKKYAASYAEWEPKQTTYSVCKIDKDGLKVTFNILHPLFKTKVNDEVIKRLSLGILVIAEGRKDSRELVHAMNRLLEEVFKE